MKHYLILTLLAIFPLSAFAVGDHEIETLITALIQVESSGRDNAIGDHGKSWGCLQIRKCVIADVNQYAKTNFKQSDALNRENSKQICRLYFKRYGNWYQRTTGREPTIRELAYLWNGGPKAMKTQNTNVKRYWAKVQKVLDTNNVKF